MLRLLHRGGCSAWLLALLACLPPLAARAGAPPEDLPAGVEQLRFLSEGSYALSYRYAREAYSDSLSGTRHQSRDEVRSRGFQFTSSRLEREIHTLELLYAPTSRLTLSAALPLVRADLRADALDGESFTTRANGAGDLQLGTRLRFMRKGDENLHLHFALGIPTGSIHQKDNFPGGRERVPYDLQPGSGSWSIRPGLGYVGEAESSIWGVQITGALYLDENEAAWRRGRELLVTGWAGYRLTSWVSSTVRVAWSERNNVNGSDDSIDPSLRPEGDPDRRAGARLEVGPGVSLAPEWLGGHRLAVEALVPAYQMLDGPQLAAKWRMQAAWIWAF